MCLCVNQKALFAMTLLILFPASARARVVATDHFFAHDLLFQRSLVARRFSSPTSGFLRGGSLRRGSDSLRPAPTVLRNTRPDGTTRPLLIFRQQEAGRRSWSFMIIVLLFDSIVVISNWSQFDK